MCFDIYFIQPSIFVLISAVPCRQMFKPSGTTGGKQKIPGVPCGSGQRGRVLGRAGFMCRYRDTSFSLLLDVRMDLSSFSWSPWDSGFPSAVWSQPQACPAPHCSPQTLHALLTAWPETLLSFDPLDTQSSRLQSPVSVAWNGVYVCKPWLSYFSSCELGELLLSSS